MTSSDKDLDAALRNLRRDPPDAHGFSMGLHRRLVEAGSPAPAGLFERFREWFSSSSWAPGSLAGAVVGAATFALFFTFIPPPPSQEGPTQIATASEVHVVSAQKVALIHFQFSADQDVRDVNMRVSLPEGLAFWADGEMLEERSFAWVTDLRSGSNDVPIAVRGDSPGRYTVVASAVMDGQWVDHRVVLEVTKGS